MWYNSCRKQLFSFFSAKDEKDACAGYIVKGSGNHEIYTVTVYPEHGRAVLISYTYIRIVDKGSF